MNSKNNSKATASLVLGIISILTCGVPLFTIPLSIISMVLSSKGKQSEKRGLATGGLITAMIGLALTIIVFLFRFLSGAMTMTY